MTLVVVVVLALCGPLLRARLANSGDAGASLAATPFLSAGVLMAVVGLVVLIPAPEMKEVPA